MKQFPAQAGLLTLGGYTIGIMLISAGLIQLVFGSEPVIGYSARRAARFGIVAPASAALARVERASVRYDPASATLSYAAYLEQNGTKLSFTEQTLPAHIRTSPELYDKLVVKLNRYRVLESPVGPVSLTRPTELAGGQSAIIRTQDTLTIIRPSAELSDRDWQSLASNLKVLP